MKFVHYRFITLFFYLLLGVMGNCYANDNPDSLTYYGHSFFKIKTSEGKVVYIDPYAVNAFADSADVVLITHEHSDHNELNRVRRKSSCQVIRSANTIISGVYQSFTIGNIKVTGTAAYNSNHAKSSCVGFVIEFDGIKIYHAGDTGLITEMSNLASANITYALIPMDGIYTMSPEEATQAAVRINAKHDIPMHTMPPPDTYSNAIVARFTSPNKLIVRPGTSMELSSSPTAVENTPVLPQEFKLNQNYPNPFNPSTTISYSIPKDAEVVIKVFDTLGREVTKLLDGFVNAGRYNVVWNGSNSASGIYFYSITFNSQTLYKKMLLMK